MSVPVREGLLPPREGAAEDRGRVGPGGPAPARRGRRGLGGRRLWLLALVAVLAWSLWDAGVGRSSVLNLGGTAVALRFVGGALSPDLSGGYLAQVATATLVTLAYAVLGTVLSVLAGLVGAVVLSQTWWRGRRVRRTGPAAGWLGLRAALALPRGLHEAVWGLLLVVVLGPDPVAGVLAIAVPYGAVTAKVYADLLDEAPRPAYTALLASGAPRLAACVYGLLPAVAADMLSYALYRFDCAIRSAAILGIVGAGGLGLLLDNAFQDLSYGRMWTAIYALVVVCALGDVVSRWLRRRVGGSAGGGLRADGRGARGLVARRPVVVAGCGVLVAVVASWAYLRLDLGTLVSERARTQAAYIGGQAWPPRLPDGGLGALVRAAVETLQMSVVAMAVATALAVVAAPLAARVPADRPGAFGRVVGWVCRSGLLLMRAVPPPAWALVLLFVLYPGPLPGALALAAYNVGVLGRLTTEVVEDLDPGPARALRAGGAGRAAVTAYAVLPVAGPRFAAYALYRWEVAVRETVVVGLVGAGGLGYLLARQLAAFDWRSAATTLLALVVLTFGVDLVSAAARRALR